MNNDLLNKEEGYAMLSALSGIYISIHFLDLKEDIIKAFKSNEFIDNCINEVDGLQNKANNVMEKIAIGDHVKVMLEFVDLSSLSERLRGKNDISIVFEGKLNGWCRARFIAMEREADAVTKAIFTVECINEEKLRENHLLYLAGTDLMTGLYNRGNGESTIREYLSNSKEGVFCLFDVDHFKQVNDTYGHGTGDKVLIAVANCLSTIKRDGDVVMRLGGDEFAAFFSNITIDELTDIVKELFDMIDQISIAPMKEKVRISLGATLAKAGMDFDTVYKLADEGVYKGKDQKGNSYTIV